MKRQESVEDYLETILLLNKSIGAVRSIDIANHLSFSKPSVSVAMKNLRSLDYINTSKDGYITLTLVGNEIACEIYERHLVLTKALTLLGVPEDIAKEDACRIEHDIHKITLLKIKEYMEKLNL